MTIAATYASGMFGANASITILRPLKMPVTRNIRPRPSALEMPPTPRLPTSAPIPTAVIRIPKPSVPAFRVWRENAGKVDSNAIVSPQWKHTRMMTIAMSGCPLM